MAMPTRDGFNLRRDHGFRNPPVQPPWPFPGASGAWQHRGRPPPSPLSSSTPYKNDPQAAFNFRRAPGPWRSDEPLGRPNQQQQPSALTGQHAVNGRGAPASGVSGCVIGGAAESGGAEGAAAAAAAAAAVLGGMATTEMPTPRVNTPLDAVGAVFASGGGDGWREATAAPAQDQQGSTPRAAAAKRGTSSDVTTTAGGSGIEVGCAKETGSAAASTPVLEDTMQQDRDGRGFDRGVAGEPVLEAMGPDVEGRDARDDEREEGADPDQGWTLSTEWEDYLRKSPGVSKYLQRMQATVSTWKDGRGGKKGGGKNNNNNNKGKMGRKSSSSNGGTTDETKQQDSKGYEKSFLLFSSKQPRRQKQQQQQKAAAAASQGGKKTGKKQSKNKGACAQGGPGGEGGEDSAAAIAKQALDLELAKIHAQALLYAEQQQHRRVEDAVADIAVAGPE